MVPISENNLGNWTVVVDLQENFSRYPKNLREISHMSKYICAAKGERLHPEREHFCKNEGFPKTIFYSNFSKNRF